MDIKTYVEELLIEQGELFTTILEISKTGSQLFNDDPNDLDFMIVCEGHSQMKTKVNVDVDGVHYDLFIYDKEALLGRLDFNDTTLPTHLKLYNYFQELREVVYGEYHTGWNMLDHEVDYKKYILDKYTKLNIEVPTAKRRHGKNYVHEYIILKIYENQSILLTEEIINNVKLLYSNGEECYPVIDWVINNI